MARAQLRQMCSPGRLTRSRIPLIKYNLPMLIPRFPVRKDKLSAPRRGLTREIKDSGKCRKSSEDSEENAGGY